MITNYSKAREIDSMLLAISEQLQHYLACLRSKTVKSHHHYSVSVHQLKNWITKLETLSTVDKAVLLKLNPLWTTEELGNIHNSLVRIDIVLHPLVASALHDGCWSVIEIEKLTFTDTQLLHLIVAVEKELNA